MTQIEKALNWLNGKKTVIGFGLVALAGGITAYCDGSGTTPYAWIKGIQSLLYYTGDLCGMAGIAHKLAKGEFSSS